jgi:hypothetical protein
MFIDAQRNEGRPPSGGPCQSVGLGWSRNTNMALLTEGARLVNGFYKRGPPDGGKFINCIRHLLLPYLGCLSDFSHSLRGWDSKKRSSQPPEGFVCRFWAWVSAKAHYNGRRSSSIS